MNNTEVKFGFEKTTNDLENEPIINAINQCRNNLNGAIDQLKSEGKSPAEIRGILMDSKKLINTFFIQGINEGYMTMVQAASMMNCLMDEILANMNNV